MDIEETFARIKIDKFHPDDQKEIRGWQDRATELAATKDWIQHPGTMLWMKGKFMEIKRINLLLVNPRTTEKERDRLFGEKAAHEFDLEMYYRNPDSELQNIRSKADEALAVQKESGMR